MERGGAEMRRLFLWLGLHAYGLKGRGLRLAASRIRRPSPHWDKFVLEARLRCDLQPRPINPRTAPTLRRHVAPAQAGAHRALWARPTDVMGPSLRWSYGVCVRMPRLNALCHALRQSYFPWESRVINMAARFA